MTSIAERDTLVEAAGEPVWLADFCEASDVCPAIGPRRFLHAGPPIEIQELTGPSRGAVIAGLLLEGEADSPEDAARMLDDGGVEITSCHAVGAVGALAGVVTPHTPVVVVEDSTGRRCFSPLNEGLGKATRFGNYDESSIQRLRWMGDVLAPALAGALRETEAIDVLEIQAEGLRRGDECHNRNVACVALLGMQLAAPVVATSPRDVAGAVLRELASNVHFFLSVSIAAAKLVADRVDDTAPPGIVTAIAANGRTIGIRVSGLPGQWFEALAHLPERITLREGFTRSDASPLLGDSAVAETMGLGASAFTSSPVLAQRLGMPFRDAERIVADLRRVCLIDHPRYLLPTEGLRGSPFAISVERVVETGVLPTFSAGFAHRHPGGGPVAAGLTSVPLEVFHLAQAGLGQSSAVSRAEP
ncbi:MAG: DUF1116 domain-containing protein [Acidimicrobiia bacterium]